ncbi:hypothetical protein CHISP_3149 [Chitinispirillum alkaliphilum]|nr:hypothetical protein CHISP_3149 [Chitinispirillum alkaliphilum]
MSKEKRKLQRKNLVYYLKVNDKRSGDLLGYLVDITREGIMVVQDTPFLEKTIFDIELELPADFAGPRTISVKVETLWCKRDINPDFYAAGFRLLDVSQFNQAVIDQLSDTFGLQP